MHNLDVMQGSIITTMGDGHFSKSTPESRIDDFAQTSLEKIDSLRQVCEEIGTDVLIMVGDVFHHNQQSLLYVNRVIDHFRGFEKSGIKVYSIFGNHDLTHERWDSHEKSPLRTLMEAGVVHQLNTLILQVTSSTYVQIDGYQYHEAIKKFSPKGDNYGRCIQSLCVAHRFYNTQDDTAIKPPTITYSEYDGYLLGHDHITYKPVRVGNRYILRPGGFMRGTAHDYNLQKDVVVDTLQFEESGKFSYKRSVVPTKSSEEVFSISSFNKPKKRDSFLSDLVQNVEELLTKISRVDLGDRSIYDVLEVVEAPEEVKKRIVQYLEASGIYRTKEME